MQLTTGAEGESAPRWSPDGASIAFIAKRTGDEATQIYLLPVAGGEAARLTTHETAVSAIAWAPDGKAIYFLASDPKTAAEKAQDKAKDDIYAYDEDFKQTHLWKVDVATRQADAHHERRVLGGLVPTVAATAGVSRICARRARSSATRIEAKCG